MRQRGRAAALAAGLILAIFASAPAAAACPNAGLRSQAFVFVTARGKFRYNLEIAVTPRQQECGLMFRKQMARNVGMYFPMDAPKETAVWMEDTPLPLDLIFLDGAGRVLSIKANAKPNSRMIIGSGGITTGLIELNAGEAARIGLRPGDRVER